MYNVLSPQWLSDRMLLYVYFSLSISLRLFRLAFYYLLSFVSCCFSIPILETLIHSSLLLVKDNL